MNAESRDKPQWLNVRTHYCPTMPKEMVFVAETVGPLTGRWCVYRLTDIVSDTIGKSCPYCGIDLRSEK